MPTQPTIGLPDEFLKEGAIPQSPLALQPPKAVVPEDKPLNFSYSEPLTDDIYKNVGQFQEEQTRMEELQGQITSVKDKIIETEKLKAEALKKEEADRKAGELSQEEKTAFGVVDNKEDPVLTELQQQQTQINTDFTNVQNELEVLKTGMSVAQSNLIGSIQDTFDVRRKAMEDVNMREQAMYQTLSIRLGGRYAPLSTTNIVSTAERQGIMRLAELDALEKSTIVQAQLAYSKQEFEIVFNEMENLNDQRESTNKQIRELQGITRKRNEEIQQEATRLKNQSSVIQAVRGGALNIVDIFERLGGQVDLEEINDTFDILLEDEVGFNETVVDRFSDAEGNRVLVVQDKSTGNIKTLRVGTVPTTQAGITATDEQIEATARNIIDGLGSIRNVPTAIRNIVNEEVRRLREQGVQPDFLTKRLSDTQVKQVSDFDTTIAAWANVKDLVSQLEDKFGPTTISAFDGSMTQFIRQFAKDPEFSVAFAEIEKAFQLYRKETTGAQASDKEIAILRPLLPQLKDTPSIFFAKLDETVKGTERAKSIFLDTLEKAKIDVGAFKGEEQQTNEIKVREISSGQIGFLPENEFNSKLFERLE